MCLERVTSRRPKLREGVGWKIFTREPLIRSGVCGRFVLCGQFKTTITPRPRKEWLDEKKYRESHSGDRITESYDYYEKCKYKTYITGWHIYLKKPKFRIWDHEVVRKVYYRRAVAEGVQNELPCVVSKKMFIP